MAEKKANTTCIRELLRSNTEGDAFFSTLVTHSLDPPDLRDHLCPDAERLLRAVHQKSCDDFPPNTRLRCFRVSHRVLEELYDASLSLKIKKHAT